MGRRSALVATERLGVFRYGRHRSGQLRMVWNEASRRETTYILKKIPPLSAADVDALFRGEDRFDGKTEPETFDFIPDPDDRKFAALCAASGATLVSNDSHLLDYRDRLDFPVRTPSEFLKHREE